MTHAPGHDAKGKRENPQRWAQLDAEAWAKKARSRGTTLPPPGMSPDLAALKAKYGITTDVAGLTADPDDPWVIVSRTTPNPDQFGPGNTLNVPQRKKLSDVLRDFYRLRGDDLVQLQAQLFRSGFYSGDIDFDDIEVGVHDEDTFKAFQRAVGRAAAFADAGQDVALEDVLSTVSPRMEKGSAGSGRERGAVTLSNPESIVRGVEKIAKEVVGHRLTEPQRRAAVALWQQLEATYQAQADAAIGGGTVVKPPAFDEFAEGYAEQIDPQGAFRQDAISGMNEFYSLLGASDG